MNKLVTIKNKEGSLFMRKKTKPFDITQLKDAKKSPEIRALIKEMRVIMNKENGVGLSANQIGIQERFFVAQVPDLHGRMKFYAIFNPEIIKKSKDMETIEEGCLSVPNSYGFTPRHYEVTLVGYDQRGKKIKIKAWGLLARVFQHEVDHLDGKLFIDRAHSVFSSDSNEKNEK